MNLGMWLHSWWPIGIGALISTLVWSLFVRRGALLVSYGLLVLALAPWVDYYHYVLEIALTSQNEFPCTAWAILQSAEHSPMGTFSMFVVAILLLARRDALRYIAVLFPIGVVLYTWMDLAARIALCKGEVGVIDNIPMVWFFVTNALIAFLLLVWELREFWRFDFPLWWRSFL